MAEHIIDLALPAHDPNFPKPRGLLPVPPEVAEDVAEDGGATPPGTRRTDDPGSEAARAGICAR